MSRIDDPAQRAAQLAISQLFLDTELDELDLRSIARELRATGLPADELQRIYETEVAPACWRNLRAVPADVWGGFDEASLMDAIERHCFKAPKLGLLQRLRIHRWTAHTQEQWRRVHALVIFGVPT